MEHIGRCRLRDTPDVARDSNTEDRLSLSLENPTLTKLTPAVVAFRSIRQSLMGLKGKQRITEYCVYIGGRMENGEVVEALPSDIKIEQLSSASVTPELKWQVFCWIELPANLQRLTMLLYFMRVNIKVEKWELEVIVRQACQLESSTGIPEYSEFGLPVPRGINLAALLLRGLQEMITSVFACNFPIDLETVMPWKFLDGKLFQSIYKKLNDGESMPNMDKPGEAMKEIIFA